MLLMPTPGDIVVIKNCPCCGSSSSSSSSSSSGASSSVGTCCCCSFVYGGVEAACGNSIWSKTDTTVNSPCYTFCHGSNLVPNLMISANGGGSFETCEADATKCYYWYNHGTLPPFQTSATLINNLFTFFYVKSVSPLCIYTANNVPCVNGQSFSWILSPPGTGCAGTLSGVVKW